MKPALISLADIKQLSFDTSVFILVDENTKKDCLPLFLKVLNEGKRIEYIEVQAGEKFKNIESCIEIWNELESKGALRNSVLINLGGGVITDMGGFVASTYMRGVPFFNFPTTLLAMVDAAIGGKTGVDLHFVKNKIGTFAEPQGIYIITTFLNTLDHNELVSGFAEMLKHGLVADKPHYENLTQIDQITVSSVEPFIQDSFMIKYKIVQEDPMEKGIRKILNFGHTIGHAVETYYLKKNQPILHGMAVAIGMYYETKLSQNLGYLSKYECEQILWQIKKHYTIPFYSDNEVNELLNWMQLDKKNNTKGINFSLLKTIGKCIYNIAVSEDKIALVFKN